MVINNKTSPIGTDNKKFPAVALSGSDEDFPLKEYAPHAMPEIAMSAAAMGSGASSPGDTSQIKALNAMTIPSHSNKLGLSPLNSAQPIITACTQANRIKAPTPVSMFTYENENAAAYAKRQNAEIRLPWLKLFLLTPLEAPTKIASIIAPDKSRINEQFDGSIASPSSATLPKIEFAPKAIIVMVVRKKIRKKNSSRFVLLTHKIHFD